MDIQLAQNKIARIDPEDWPLIAPYKWYAFPSTEGKWYAHATPLDGNRAKAKIKMHNLILGRKRVDHIDEDGLNNTRRNLRPCSNAQNQQNTGSRGGSSRFKGVSWNKRKRKWVVAFRWDNNARFVGYLTDEEQAARAYDRAILPLAGEFARLNFPMPA
jgi:hypothetical protein